MLQSPARRQHADASAAVCSRSHVTVLVAVWLTGGSGALFKLDSARESLGDLSKRQVLTQWKFGVGPEFLHFSRAPW